MIQVLIHLNAMMELIGTIYIKKTMKDYYFMGNVKDYMLYALFVYLDINAELFSILFGFMMLDSLLGGIKALRMGKRFSFRKLLIGISIKFVFLIVPFLLAFLGKGLGYELSIAVDSVMKILLVSEALSIFGNIYTIKTKENVESVDVVSKLLKAIRSRLKKILDTLLNSL